MKKIFAYICLAILLCGCVKEDIINVDSTTNTEITNNTGGYGNTEQGTEQQQQ